MYPCASHPGASFPLSQRAFLLDGVQERGGTARHRDYVLQPVDGRAVYSRRGRNVQRDEDEPVVEMDFQLDVIAVQLSSEAGQGDAWGLSMSGAYQ
jgi:hypothetical protein